MEREKEREIAAGEGGTRTMVWPSGPWSKEKRGAWACGGAAGRGKQRAPFVGPQAWLASPSSPYSAFPMDGDGSF